MMLPAHRRRRAGSLPVLILAGLAVAALSAFAASMRPAHADECAIPEELLQDDSRLEMTKAHLAPGKTLKIVVIGGSSTAGTAAGSTDKSYPRRLQEILSERHPGTTIVVENKGLAHQSAQQMLDRFDRDVIGEQPTLAIWETGITDAVRGVDPEEFAVTMQSGLDRLKDSKIEAMLIDMQFSRATASVINFDSYLNALHHAADINDIYVFRRYQMMRYWSENGVFDFDNWPKAGAQLAARVYDCVARRLADAIELVAR